MIMDTPNIPNGIPVVVCGIPTIQTEEGIVTPFPYLNSESDDWKGEDDLGFDSDGGTALKPVDPDEPDFGGGDEVEPEEDEDDDIDTGFGVGIGLLGGFFAPPPLLPA